MRYLLTFIGTFPFQAGRRSKRRRKRKRRRRRGRRRKRRNECVPGHLLVQMFLHLLKSLSSSLSLFDRFDVLLVVGDLVVSVQEHLRVLFYLFRVSVRKIRERKRRKRKEKKRKK